MSLFSIRLRSLRKEEGSTQQDLADFLDVTRTNYGGYERGEIVPPYVKIKKLADRFDVTVEYLMGSSNFKNYDLNDKKVPDILNQLKLISDELMSITSAVQIDGRMMKDEEKQKLLPMINSCIDMVEFMKLTNSKDK
jgi:transcriptional regulator with XRE-family HTH domain